jgi:hypothetical protein
MNHELLLYSYYPEAIRRAPELDVAPLVAGTSHPRRARRWKGGEREYMLPIYSDEAAWARKPEALRERKLSNSPSPDRLHVEEFT